MLFLSTHVVCLCFFVGIYGTVLLSLFSTHRQNITIPHSFFPLPTQNPTITKPNTNRDLGDVAQALRVKQRLLVAPKPLTVRAVYQTIVDMSRMKGGLRTTGGIGTLWARALQQERPRMGTDPGPPSAIIDQHRHRTLITAGQGCEGRKRHMMVGLIRACRGPEAKFLGAAVGRSVSGWAVGGGRKNEAAIFVCVPLVADAADWLHPQKNTPANINQTHHKTPNTIDNSAHPRPAHPHGRDAYLGAGGAGHGGRHAPQG